MCSMRYGVCQHAPTLEKRYCFFNVFSYLPGVLWRRNTTPSFTMRNTTLHPFESFWIQKSKLIIVGIHTVQTAKMRRKGTSSISMTIWPWAALHVHYRTAWHCAATRSVEATEGSNGETDAIGWAQVMYKDLHQYQDGHQAENVIVKDTHSKLKFIFLRLDAVEVQRKHGAATHASKCDMLWLSGESSLFVSHNITNST